MKSKLGVGCHGPSGYIRLYRNHRLERFKTAILISNEAQLRYIIFVEAIRYAYTVEFRYIPPSDPINLDDGSSCLHSTRIPVDIYYHNAAMAKPHMLTSNSS